MNLWKLKYNIGFVVTVKLYQPTYSSRIIEIAKPFRSELTLGFDAGVFIKIIIIAQVVLVKQQIYLLTAIAAKDFIIDLKGIILTGFITMVTGNLYRGTIN